MLHNQKFHKRKIYIVEHLGMRSPNVPYSKVSQREIHNCGSLGGVDLKVLHNQKFHKRKIRTVEHLGTGSIVPKGVPAPPPF